MLALTTFVVSFYVADSSENEMILSNSFLQANGLKHLLDLPDEQTDFIPGNEYLSDIESVKDVAHEEIEHDDPDLQARTTELMEEFHDLLQEPKEPAHLQAFNIMLKPDAPPMPSIPPRRLASGVKEQIQQEIDKLLELGIIEECTATTASPIV